MDTSPVAIHNRGETDGRQRQGTIPSTPLDAGAPEERGFRARGATRLVAAVAAVATSLHLPLRGGARSPTRLVAAMALFAGAVGLLSHRRWAVSVTLGGCALAWGTMLARPLRLDPLASAAIATAALAAGDLRRIPQ